MARVLCTIFCRQTLENRDWRRGHEAMSQQIPQVDQAMLETTLDRMVRKTVEEMLNAMLDAEVDEITGVTRYERSGERKAYRAGHYERDLTVKAGKVSLKVPAISSDARQANVPPMPSNDHRAGSGWNATVNHPNEESATSNNGNRKNVRILRYACGIKRQLRAVYSMSSHGLMGVQNGIYQPRTPPSTGNKASAAYNK